MTRLLLLCCFATGCSLYWGGDDVKNDDCVEKEPASPSYRDPSTGACINEGGGGSTTCGCGEACPGTGGAGYPDWGQCYTSCDSLDESDCITTSGCHAAYVETVLGAPVSTHTFYGCWATAPGGEATGSCSGLDDQACSTRDNCSMVYTGYEGAPQSFERCFDETTTTSDPGQCTGTLQCGMGPPTCPANTTPGIANGCWSGFCIPNAQCGGTDPGQCYAPVLCDIVGPSCPAGTLPGIKDGCYSGYCIPISSCEPAPCGSLDTEATCEARADCTPIYTGTNCTCTSSGCTCTDETYMSCESLVGGL